ncbi:D-alanyl-D-alanine carboxypeptidase [Eubacterium sp. MSJ-13]|uniref:D-alanyl-D-alanine carboxypeptidase family protein n=1 Tax=Eubacterium sp. MSJ-13 TaxID=2841513 RepID=UPI001C12325C|nr:D-alanyl-D-alanine carboxypeptidase family protein [Eubacterium sp. MSJ-13]MBU5478313.1 D-alanyl-D-alanine carboxypeptidase [Eubacterium sp. MSJ-13]
MKTKRILSSFMAVVILCCSLIAGVPAQAKSDAWPKGPSAKSLVSGSAVVVEVSTGTVLYGKNMHTKHYPASITKVLTALLAAENSSPSDTVKFSKAAAYGISAGDSTVFSEPGEKMSMEQCLYAIMLESANEVCLAAAEHVSGSVKSFVNLMNKRVKELGLKDTHFNNPNGLPDPNHYTTAYDMAMIGRAALKNSVFRKVCNTPKYTCAKTNKHKMKRIWLNHHEAINPDEYPQYGYKYCIGGKTGYTHVAGNTLITFAEKDGMQLVCVVMKSTSQKNGEPNQYTDTIKLLNYCFGKYKKHNVGGADSKISQDLFDNYGSFFNSSNSPVRFEDESSVVLPNNVKLSKAKQKIVYDKNVKIRNGKNVIGKVTYTYAGKLVGSSNIIYDSTKKTHLDEASRKVVSKEIKAIEKTNANPSIFRKIFTGIRDGISGGIYNLIRFILENPVLSVVIFLVIIVIVIFIISAVTGKSVITSRSQKRHGGYKSKMGRKNHARRVRQDRKDSSKKSVRRNHSKHYAKQTASSKENVSGRNNAGYSRRRKNTRESFGKNFFDF